MATTPQHTETTDRAGRFERPEAAEPQTTASPIDQHAAPTADTAKRSGKATASLIVGILALPGAIMPIAGLILGVIAAALGGAARGEIARNGKTNGWMATAGLVLGVIAIIASVGIFVAALSSAS